MEKIPSSRTDGGRLPTAGRVWPRADAWRRDGHTRRIITIAELYGELHTSRDQAERLYSTL
jgi:hypothetical protein